MLIWGGLGVKTEEIFSCVVIDLANFKIPGHRGRSGGRGPIGEINLPRQTYFSLSSPPDILSRDFSFLT